MKSDISKTLIAVTLVSLMFLTFGGLAHYAQAVTVITVDDEASCEALPLRDPANPDVLVGNPTWDSLSHTCQIPEETELQIREDEVLDLHVSIINAGSIRNLNGVIDIAARNALNTWMGGVENYGTINIRGGAELVMGDASFFNSRDAIVNNYGEIAGSSDNPRFTNVGTINNFDTGRIRTHGEMRLYNDPQGVINNYGFINIDLWGLVNDGIINNFATAIVRHGGEGGIGTPAPRQGTLINFGSMEISSGFFDSYHNVETISNHGVIQITRTSPSSADVFNDGTIINQAEGVIENFAKFRNPGVINNQGLIAIYCGGTFINTGTFTGTPIKNSCESVPPAITAPSDTTLTTTGTRLNPCQNIGVAGISAIGDDGGGNVATNTLDNNLGTRWSRGGSGAWIKPDLGSTKVICSLDIAWYKGDQRTYFFDVSVSNNGVNFKKVFSGSSSGTTLSSERYEFADSVGRYVKITFVANSVNQFASITEIDVNGYSALGLPVFSDNVDPFPIVQNNVPSNGLPVGSNTVTWTATDLNGNTNSDTQIVKVVTADSTLPTISISSPATGSTITGPSNGVKVNLKGTAFDTGSGILKVELKTLKSGVTVYGYQQATPSSPNNWGSWSHTLTFSQTGTYTITARATDKAGNQNWYNITVKIAFESDTAVPTVSITSPQNRASFSGPSDVPKKISLAGIAADSGTGVQKVELKSLKSGTVVHAYQLAGTSNNWSNWSKTLSFSQAGTYTITARVTDNAGNQNWHSITVNINFN